MEIVEKIHEHVKKMPFEMANEVLDFVEFLESKHQNIQETDYVLNNPFLMAQIAQSQKTFENETGYIATQEQLDALD
jgi:hypothetical protein